MSKKKSMIEKIDQLMILVEGFLQSRDKSDEPKRLVDNLIAAGILKWGLTQAGDIFTLNGIGQTVCDSDTDWRYDKDCDTLYWGSVPVYNKGTWATLTPAKGNT